MTAQNQTKQKTRAMMKAVTCEFTSSNDETQSKTLTGNAVPSITDTIPYHKKNSRLGELRLIYDSLLLEAWYQCTNFVCKVCAK